METTIYYISQLWSALMWITAQVWFNPTLELITVVVLLVTVRISMRMLQTTNRINEMQLLPVLGLYFEGTRLDDKKVFLKNVGSSYAFDVNIEPYFFITIDSQTVDKIEFILPGTNALGPEEKVELKVRATRNGELADIKDFYTYILDPRTQFEGKRTVELVATFRNPEGNNYYSKFITGNNGLSIQPAKRLTLYGSYILWFRSLDERIFFMKSKIVWKFVKPHISYGAKQSILKSYFSRIFWGKKIS